MAGTHRQSRPDLKEDLLADGRSFSFFQALRLLNRIGAESPEIRVRPELSLSFPVSDISGIEELPSGKGFQITTTFFGLYGASSPLPAFYTEDLFRDGRDDSTAARDFIDLLHRRLYLLLFEAWKKYRLFVQVSEGQSQNYLNMLYAISGLSARPTGEYDQESYELIRYTGLLGGHPRSALALQTILADVLGGLPVEIISCVPRPVKIHPDQRLCVRSNDANPLGKNTFLGEEVIDAQGKFRVRIGPVEQSRFRPLLPGGQEGKKLARLIDRFLTDPLDYDFELILAEGEMRNTCLGAPEWSRLGLDTVLFAGEFASELRIVC